MAVTVVRIAPLAYRPVGQHFAQRNTRPTRICGSTLGTIAIVEVNVAIDFDPDGGVRLRRRP
jgi:hypothetical protein